MPRPHKCRQIAGPPAATAFKPLGVPGRLLDAVDLRLDELEALRLADLEGLYQDAAAERMGISRPTFGRLLDAAHRKVADALLNGKLLRFEGGAVAIGAPMNPQGPGRCRRGRGGHGHGHGRGCRWNANEIPPEQQGE